MKALVGVDIGTQGTKAAVFDDAGECLGAAFQPSRLIRPRPGHVEESPDDLLNAVCNTIRKALSLARLAPGDVAAVAIDGQMAGVIGIGADGRAVTPYDSWLDTRCTKQVAEMSRRAGDRILAQSGCAPSINHGPKMLWWKENKSRDYKRVAAFVQPGGYVAMRLCGLAARDAFIDLTYLHFSSFAHTSKATWDGALVEMFGIDPEKLPTIVRPEQIVGQITAAMSRRCGLKARTPVAAGCGDTAASFLSAGATQEGICVDVAGTASVFAATLSEFKPDSAHQTLAIAQSPVPGQWHSYAYINGGGMNLEWFRENFTRGQHGAATLKELDTAASELTDAQIDSLPMFVPHMEGRVNPSQPGLRGAWVGLSWSHTAADLYRAVLESVALEYALYKGILSQLDPSLRFKEVRVAGGGGASALWNSIKADVLQVPVCPVNDLEGATRGAAMVAGWAAGLFKDLPHTACTWVRRGTAVRPNPRRAAHYQQRLAKYDALLKRLDQCACKERS